MSVFDASSMNIKKLLAVTIITGTCAVGAMGLAPAPAGAADNQACLYGQWPSSVEGRPANVHAGDPAGLALWHDPLGWHAYVTHANHQPMVFRVTIQSPSTIAAVGTYTEGGDVVIEHANSHSVTLRATNYGYLDGLHFRVACGQGITVSATVAGVRLPASRVFMGAAGTHPAAVPTTITRS